MILDSDLWARADRYYVQRRRRCRIRRRSLGRNKPPIPADEVDRPAGPVPLPPVSGVLVALVHFCVVIVGLSRSSCRDRANTAPHTPGLTEF